MYLFLFETTRAMHACARMGRRSITKDTHTYTNIYIYIHADLLGVTNRMVSFCLWWYVSVYANDTYIDIYRIHLYRSFACVHLCLLCSCDCFYQNQWKMSANQNCQNGQKHVAHRGPAFSDNGWPRASDSPVPSTRPQELDRCDFSNPDES